MFLCRLGKGMLITSVVARWFPGVSCSFVGHMQTNLMCALSMELTWLEQRVAHSSPSTSQMQVSNLFSMSNVNFRATWTFTITCEKPNLIVAVLIFQLQAHWLQVLEYRLLAVKAVYSHPQVGHLLMLIVISCYYRNINVEMKACLIIKNLFGMRVSSSA